jgi:hypothetical protein
MKKRTDGPTTPVQFYVSESERKILEELAWRQRLSMSELIRQLLKDTARAEKLWPIKAKEKELA